MNSRDFIKELQEAIDNASERNEVTDREQARALFLIKLVPVLYVEKSDTMPRAERAQAALDDGLALWDTLARKLDADFEAARERRRKERERA